MKSGFIAVAGRPNVGKSSLLNALLRESRAIVTEVPGTTRDVIEEAVNIRGIPLRAIDTAGLRDGRPFLLVINKADLPSRLDPRPLADSAAPRVRTVAPTGEGIDALEDAIAAHLLGAGVSSEDVLVSNARHRARLESAAAALRQALATVEAGFEQAMVAIDLKIAAEALGEITGESVTEATISEIFARFCVGK